MAAPGFDTRLVTLRGVAGTGLQRSVTSFATTGPELWAGRQDVSDGEKLAGGQNLAERIVRFRLRAIGHALTITTRDRLQVLPSEAEFDILGIKTMTGARLIEITARERADGVLA